MIIPRDVREDDPAFYNIASQNRFRGMQDYQILNFLYYTMRQIY